MSLTCIRPLPLTSGSGTPLTRDLQRKNDLVRCLCGQPVCRDSDLKREAK